MNNEIGRKLTSLTLMAIMVAGGMTFAVPGMMPAAHAANANLFVSAENSDFDNYMSGPQVIEVVVIDSDINDTGENKGEAKVTVNGKTLRMVQAVDGNWYGYFADYNMATIANNAVNATGSSLDFGSICATTSNTVLGTGLTVSDSDGFAGNFNDDCNNIEANTNNVVREAKSPSGGGTTSVPLGQINVAANAWPFIQLYKLTPTGNVVVQYDKGGGAQKTTLTFDTADDFAGLKLDRTVYPQSAQVHATITDLWLNIDPTDEDSWTFATGDNAGTYYQIFDENGQYGGLQTTGKTDITAGEIPVYNLSDDLGNLMCGDCALLIDLNAQNADNNVLTIQDNGDSILGQTAQRSSDNATSFFVPRVTPLGEGTYPVTITEQGPNTGIFGTYDESNESVLKITSNAARGTSASIDYNDTPQTVLVGFNFASIDIAPVDDTWNSGETIPVTIVDGDQNKNSKVDEDLLLTDPNAIIPALKTGNPFTLGSAGDDDGKLQVMYARSNTANEGGLLLLGNNAIGNGGGNITTGTVYSDDTRSSDVLEALSTGQDTGIAELFVEDFSDRALQYIDEGVLQQRASDGQETPFLIQSILIDYEATAADLKKSINKDNANGNGDFTGFNFFNYDIRSVPQSTAGSTDDNPGEVSDVSTTVSIYLVYNTTHPIINGTGVAINGTGHLKQDYVSAEFLNSTAAGSERWVKLVDKGGLQGYVSLGDGSENTTAYDLFAINDTANIGLFAYFSTGFTGDLERDPIVADFFSFGFYDDGVQASERVANQIIRIEAEESDLNTGSFVGDLEYVMVNQLNIQEEGTFEITTIGSDPSFIVMEDLTDEDAPRVSYNDLGKDGVVTPVSDQQEAPSHSGVVSLNQDSYKVADTVVITLEDADLNVDSDLIDIYTVVKADVATRDMVGSEKSQSLSFGELGRLLDVSFNGELWTTYDNCSVDDTVPNGLGATGFSLIETGTATGVFKGDFQIPGEWCDPNEEPTPKAPYSPVSATGTDIAVDYVDFRDASGEIIEVGDSAGIRANTGSVSFDRTVYPVPFGDGKEIPGLGFPLHSSAEADNPYLPQGDLTVHIRVNDPDFDVNPSGEDNIAVSGEGIVKIEIQRGSAEKVIATVGNAANPIGEIAPDAGIFEYDLVIEYDDGPGGDDCPAAFKGNGCVLQGDILHVEYTDPTDASGEPNSVTDSATFDLRNGVLQSDKSVYIIGSDMVLTLIEPDFDLDNDAAETYNLDLIEWDSDAATTSMGKDGRSDGAFDPEPTDLRETGDSTGIFQVLIEIPSELDGDPLERGEEIVLEYTDMGPSGADYVGHEDEDVTLTVFTSNFGATIELDQKVYTWTDKVYITIVAPDHNFDSDLVDEIGDGNADPLKVSTRGDDLDNYKLVETGPDTGIFTGEVILTGFTHNADGDTTTGDDNGNDVVSKPAEGHGPTDGLLPASDDDGLTVAFEFSEDETVVGSALVRWNIGEVQWLEASYPASGTGVVRVIDPDMNLNPEAVDNFDVDVWSDSDAGGIDLTVTETNEATGIFEGTVFFTVTDESSGHRLRVAEGDTVTTEYEDNTLPDPYTTADELDITATSLIGTVVPPLERVPATNLRVVDAFSNSLDSVSVDQQVQITADLANGQDREQSFAYLVQIQDANGVTVSLAWITGSLSAGQSFSPALSWIPTEAGTYTATAFVWESVDNPTALSPPISTTVNVS